MKKVFLSFAVLALCWLSGTVLAEDYNMPKFGYEEKTIADGETLTFFDFNGEGDIPSSSSSNSYSTVVFKPAAAGYAINLNFEYIEVANDGTGWVSLLDIYDGVFDKNLVSGGTYPTSVTSSTTKFSDLATPLQHFEDADVTNQVFNSSDASGAMSVCFHYRYAGASKGWKATVSVVKLKDMVLTSASALYDFVDPAAWAGKQNVAFGGVNIVADGGGNPDALTKITFTLDGASTIDVSSLDVYVGKASDVSLLAGLSATITESEGVYTATFNKTLGNGNNYFTIGGDILSSAAFGSKQKVTITGIETAGGFTTFTPATPVEVEVQAMYLMGTDATYDVSQDAAFYDDGGKDGKRSNNFTGHTTFRPTTSGKKVQINFSTISLFYNSSAVSVGNQDVLKIYNGTSVNEANLLYTVEVASTSNLVIKSTSSDGALTVYLATKNPAESMKGDGWEATVSEFTPVAMSVTNSEVEKNSVNACAGQTGVQLLSFNLKTQDTEPALALKSLVLNAGTTAAQLKNAKVYYTGVKKEFSTTTLVASAAVSDATITLTAETAQTLREGDNWFWVTLDMADRAANGTSADVQLTQVTFADNSTYTTFSNPEGGITVKNIIYSTEGTKNYDIFGTWEFTHTKASEYSDNYATGTTDQITIFRPTTSGRVIQMEFADFEVYYSYYKAKFEVYDGEDTSGTKLFEVTSSELASAVPPIMRSTSGALTVVFNPNTSYSYYVAKGWHATVSEYELTDMSLDTIMVEQASTKLVKLGAQKAELLNMDIATEGTLNPLRLDAVVVNLKGSEANISKVYVLSGTTVLGEVAAASGDITISIESVVNLNEYHNNFVIAVDVKDDATIDEMIDASIKSVTLTASVQTVPAGDPEGSRVIKNVMNMAAGDNGTVTIGANSLMFYDDGGADEDYTSNFEGYVTFVPANAGYAVELVFRDFDIAYLSGDPFRIYYASAYDSEATPDKKFGMYSMPEENESVITKAADGSVTVYVKMPSSRKRGFEVEVRQHLLTNLVIDSVTVSAMAPAEATKGTGDLQWMRAAVYVSGDCTPITITAFEQTASELLTDRHIYATGHSTTFSTTTEFTDSYAMDEKGVYYFWFIGSISTEAEIGNAVTWQLNNVVCGENKTAPKDEVVATVNVVSGAHGYYRIGASNEADYPTLTAALHAISSIGMDGAVTLAIESGLYTEQVTVPELNGAGAANTLTIRSISGDYNDVTYQFNSGLTSTQGVFTIAGADYVTVKGISFTSTYTSNQTPTVFIVNNAATHVTIDSCHFYAERMTEYTARLDLLRVDAGENHYNNDFVLTNSVFDGGYMGLNVAGHKAAADPLQQNMLIAGNRFQNQGKQMVYGDAVNNLQILNNTFREEVTASNQYGIDWLLVGDTAMIANNDFLFTTPATSSQASTPIYIRPNSYQDKENAVICLINNVINVQNAGEYASYGINFNSNLPKLLVAYNTVVTNTLGTAASPFYFNDKPAEGSRFVNNIFQALNKGYAVRYKNATIATNVTYEHNMFYTPETGFGMPTATFGTFADWKTAIGATDEQGNLNEAVVFTSANLLLPQDNNEGRLQTAAVLDFVTTDITGNERSTTPTIGAYEYDAALFIIPTIAEGYPKVENIKDVSAEVVIKTNNLGTAKVVVLAADATAPSVDEVLAQGTEITLKKDAEVGLTIKELTEETSYKAYVVTISPLGENATIVAVTDIFTTAWTLRPIVLAPIVKQSVAKDASVTLTATIETEYEQAKPYTFSWRTAFDDAEVGNEAALTITAATTTEYICRVTDKFGQTDAVSAHVWVEAAAAATFEEYVLAENGHKMCDDAWADGVETPLYSGSYAFANVPNKQYNAFNGFVISADQVAEASGNYMVDQFRSAAGGAYEGTNFTVAYYSAPSSWFAGYTDPITFTNSAEALAVTGFYVTNTAYTYDAVLNGDGYKPAFSTGDYMTLTVNGYNGETATGSVVFYLADYRSEDASEHFAVNEWKWLDLSELGAVTRLEFDMFTTKSNEYGFTTPTYFCLDNFGGEAPSPETGINNAASAVKVGKVIENGVLYIVLPDGSCFDARGNRIR